MRTFTILIFLEIAGLLFSSPVLSETVILKSGQRIEGKIIEKNEKYIKIDFSGVSLTYWLDEVKSIGDNGVRVNNYKSIDEILSFPENRINLLTAILLVYKEWDTNIDINKYEKRIDEIAADISRKIKAAVPKTPVEKVNLISEYLFRDLSLKPIKATVLGQAQAEHMSIGEETLFTYLLDKKEGQCMSFSYLYLVIAEKLNLPIFLVTVPYHTFVRYDDGVTKFDIETMREGKVLEDKDYIEWKSIPSDLIKEGVYLRNFNKKEAIGSALLDLAHLYAEANRNEEYLEIIEKSLKFFPNNIEASQALGGYYLQKYVDVMVKNNRSDVHILDLAIDYFQKALNIYPNYLDALINLGTAQMMKGEYDLALEKFKRVLEIKPDYGPAYQRLTALFLDTQQHKLAWEYANKAADLGWPISRKSYEDLRRKVGK